MAITKLNLQPITTESDYSNITIGNSKFTDEIWDLSPFLNAIISNRGHKKISFSFIKNEDIKFTLKLYAYYRLGKVKPQTVVTEFRGNLPSFIEYCDLNNINSFTEITKNIFLNY